MTTRLLVYRLTGDYPGAPDRIRDEARRDGSAGRCTPLWQHACFKEGIGERS